MSGGETDHRPHRRRPRSLPRARTATGAELGGRGSAGGDVTRAGGRPFPLVPRAHFVGVGFGQHRSPRRGEGDEVAGSRPFRPGDRRTLIDWRASARLSTARGTDEFVVREFFADTAPRVAVVVDRRPQMELYAPPLPWLDKRAAVDAAVGAIVAATAAAGGDIAYVAGACRPAGLAAARAARAAEPAAGARRERTERRRLGCLAGGQPRAPRPARGEPAAGLVRLRALGLRVGGDIAGACAPPGVAPRRDTDRRAGPDLGAVVPGGRWRAPSDPGSGDRSGDRGGDQRRARRVSAPTRTSAGWRTCSQGSRTSGSIRSCSAPLSPRRSRRRSSTGPSAASVFVGEAHEALARHVRAGGARRRCERAGRRADRHRRGAPASPSFGDPFSYVVTATVPADAADSTQIVDDVLPFVRVAPTRTSRAVENGVARITVTESLACLSAECVPTGGARSVVMPRVRVGGLVAPPVVVLVKPRVATKAVAASKPLFQSPATLSPVETGLGRGIAPVALGLAGARGDRRGGLGSRRGAPP